MAPTKQEMLDNVETAINALVGGAESYSIGGRTMKYRQIDELRRWREQLKREITSGGDNTTYAKFEDPR
ncbi:MAG: hypothetical protein JW847_02270 [Candidatus Omnitrophica bacterium]|nr:hypothetical protein [Candidatus Omnitrophota bacterium]